MAYKSDDIIKREVLTQLGWDTRVKQIKVGVTVNNGVVKLSGTVDSYAKKIAAQEAAHRVHGVFDVANDLEVNVPGSSQRTDTEIAQAVRHALEWNVFVPADRIRTTVTKGWVTLEGSIEDYGEGVAAVRAVRDLAAVRGVTNLIKVTTQVDPEKVKFLIEDVLELRADREANRIRVKVEEGKVTLTGAVASWNEKKAIVGAVGHMPGVTAIEDHLIIDPYGIEFSSARA
jgi:osmotically-inducible protein OsmY